MRSPPPVSPPGLGVGVFAFNFAPNFTISVFSGSELQETRAKSGRSKPAKMNIIKILYFKIFSLFSRLNKYIEYIY
uniref:hypothetical protein n=1 Tax=Borrelia hermsii TaxID=140 RepID=UPI001868398B|nr:hypothetical protein [Borrelia hermsii]